MHVKVMSGPETAKVLKWEGDLSAVPRIGESVNVGYDFLLVKRVTWHLASSVPGGSPNHVEVYCPTV